MKNYFSVMELSFLFWVSKSFFWGQCFVRLEFQKDFLERVGIENLVGKRFRGCVCAECVLEFLGVLGGSFWTEWSFISNYGVFYIYVVLWSNQLQYFGEGIRFFVLGKAQDQGSRVIVFWMRILVFFFSFGERVVNFLFLCGF